jgi:gluconate 2-dehydrogenase gamma chain
LNRREILKGAVTGAGAVAVPAAAQQHQHAAGQAASAPAPAAWQPLLFDAHQNETVVTLSELIIPATDTPGAKEAKVNEYIDLILHDGAPERRNHFLAGLAWLDGYAIRQHDKPFVRLIPEQQVGILRMLEGASDAALKPGADFFTEIKRLIVSGYYTTKIGIDELNKGGRVPQTFACTHNGRHA